MATKDYLADSPENLHDLTTRVNVRPTTDDEEGGVQSPLETYLREINETPLLSAEEEQELAHRIAQGDPEARDRMVRANLRLVVNIARGYVGKGPKPTRPHRRRQPGTTTCCGGF